MLQKIHRQIRAACPSEEAHDFIVVTDGSGFSDGYGGSSSIILSDKFAKREIRMAGFSHTSTDRAEFEGLLMGLQGILEIMDWTKEGDIKRLQFSPKKPTVCWYTDRESLVLSIWRDENGDTVYQRRKQGDLWARFEFYEKLFDISPFLIDRNSTKEHVHADRLASEARLLVKEYLEIVSIDNTKNE